MNEPTSIRPRRSRYAYRLFLFGVVWAATSSLLALILIKAGVRSSAVFAIKDAAVYLVAALGGMIWIRSYRTASLVLLLGAFGILLWLNYLLLNDGYPEPLNNIRQILAPLILLFIFSANATALTQVSRLNSRIAHTTYLVFIFGIIEQAAELWPMIDLTDFFLLKGIPVDPRGLSYMFYEPLLGYRERMTSTFLDPISLGHFFATVFSYTLLAKGASKKTLLVLFVSALGLVLSFSKGAAIQAFIASILFNSRVHFGIKGAGTLAVVGALANLDNVDGLLIHINGLYNSLKSITFFGYGIGSSGNYAKMFGSDLSTYYELGISDTYIGSLIGQIGIFGALIWVFIGCSTLVVFAQSRASLILSLKLFASITLVGVLSENTMNVTSFLGPSVLICLALNASPRHVGAPHIRLTQT